MVALQGYRVVVVVVAQRAPMLLPSLSTLPHSYASEGGKEWGGFFETYISYI
jgi:hypothetical protein